MSNSKDRRQTHPVSSQELGLFIHKYINEACLREPTKIHFISPVEILEAYLTKYHYYAIKHFSLNELIRVAKDSLPMCLIKAKKVKLIYD